MCTGVLPLAGKEEAEEAGRRLEHAYTVGDRGSRAAEKPEKGRRPWATARCALGRSQVVNPGPVGAGGHDALVEAGEEIAVSLDGG